MQSDLLLVLQITLIGMGLVFAVLIFLATLLSVLVRWTSRPQQAPQAGDALELELKQQAAVAAVAVLLAEQESASSPRFPMPPTAFVSAWQAVLRSNMLNKRGLVR